MGSNSHQLTIREAEQRDTDTLWNFLALASYERDAAAARAVPLVATYLDGWKRLDDFGFIAEVEGTPVGAVWARLLGPVDGLEFDPGPLVPEVTLAVVPHYRNQGIASNLLYRVEMTARTRGFSGLWLNVRTENPARRLYQKAGYRHLDGSEIRNRSGGTSVWMLLPFEDRMVQW